MVGSGDHPPGTVASHTYVRLAGLEPAPGIRTWLSTMRVCLFRHKRVPERTLIVPLSAGRGAQRGIRTRNILLLRQARLPIAPIGHVPVFSYVSPGEDGCPSFYVGQATDEALFQFRA